MTPLERALLDGVTVVPGDGSAAIEDAVVRLDAHGIVQSIEPGGSPSRLVLAAPAVDLHLDVMTERRRPRAGVVLELEQTLATLDAELVASGIGTVCIAARFEDEPAKGVEMADALALCDTVERLAPALVCDWRVHARVEVTEDEGPAALERALERTSRIALISVMDHSAERSRFSSYEAHRAFYSEDWGLPPDEVERILARKRAGAQGAAERRARIADIARDSGVVLATHDDRTDGRPLGAAPGCGHRGVPAEPRHRPRGPRPRAGHGPRCAQRRARTLDGRRQSARLRRGRGRRLRCAVLGLPAQRAAAGAVRPGRARRRP
ncbi:MAG TPA: hypothetical protein VK631_12555, partial [Solirubrobacteraceae bacterium]|nr:hypothetical protein [Solirubrobacteraceae bacterium]